MRNRIFVLVFVKAFKVKWIIISAGCNGDKGVLNHDKGVLAGQYTIGRQCHGELILADNR